MEKNLKQAQKFFKHEDYQACYDALEVFLLGLFL